MNIPALLSFPSSSTSTILPLLIVCGTFFSAAVLFSPGKKELISIFYFIPRPSLFASRNKRICRFLVLAALACVSDGWFDVM